MKTPAISVSKIANSGISPPAPDSPAIAAGFEPWDYADAGTVKGTVIGTATEGGATPYNAESAHVPMTKAKESFHFLVEFFCKIINFLGGIFGK